MASIPLVALDSRAGQEQQSPLDTYAKMQAILGGQQEQQTRQLQQTALGQENQQRALSLQDAQTLRSLAPNHVIKDADGNVKGFDTPGLIQAAAAKGVNPNTLTQMQNQYAESVKNLASANESVRNNEIARNKAAYEVLEGVRQADPANRASVLRQALPNLQKLGVDTSELAAPNLPLDDKSLDSFEAGLGMHQQAITDAKTAAETNKANADATLAAMEAKMKGSPLTAMEYDPSHFAGDKLFSSIGYLKSKIADPATTPADQARATRLLAQANHAQQTQLAFDKAKESARQAIADGDPAAAAKLLVDGTVAPSQLISSRKPEFAQKAFTAAAQMQQGWDARKAEADFKVASSPQNVAFFGSAKSLTDPSGTLDQLKAAGADIPDGRIPVFNSIADAIKASTGSGPIAKYASIALGVADDYSKVMGGGNGSDTSRIQALQLISAKQSPEQRAASIEGIRGAVGSQLNSRIGNNAVMQKMYGGGAANTPAKTPSGPPPGATHTVLNRADGKMHWTDSQNSKDLGVAQ
jgi:hypothetical protein